MKEIKPILYLDCDGVILDTIDYAFQCMKKEGIDTTSGEIVNHYFEQIDWNMLIINAGQINNSIQKIKQIIEENSYYLVYILTQCVGHNEDRIKIKIFNKLLPGIIVIPVYNRAPKELIVDPVNNILVDDNIEHINRWIKSGGIGYHFIKKLDGSNLHQIDDLSKLLVKKYI